MGDLGEPIERSGLHWHRIMKPIRSQAHAVILLMQPDVAEVVMAIADRIGLQLEARQASSSGELTHAAAQPFALLLSHGTNVIVHKDILARPGVTAINVHAASPAYPGRDPHHFAVYDGVSRYGATMHFMTDRVDAGPIIDVDEFPVTPEMGPKDLLDQANEASRRLIERLFIMVKCGGLGSVRPSQTLTWCGQKRTRKDFQALCRITPAMSEAEFRRRLKAVAMPGHRNLTIELHGYLFRIEEERE